jgi:serine/threonine protein kinase
VLVGRYEILEIIGTGATGRVARAHDPMIGRLVAIKLFAKELAQGAARQRFLQEARVVGQLSHPSIMTLHDMGIDEPTQTPYLVMEYLEGLPLDRMLEKGSLPFPKACAWVAEIACALGVAHRKGVIHGDVKPANVLITNDGRVKLMDFGMARLASHDTGASPLLGTPAYWCPEQILGKPQDSRSDSLQGICGRVLSSTPLPASHANPSVPSAFDGVIVRCLAKDPAARYATAEILAEELYPLARRKTVTEVQPQTNGNSLRDRAGRLLRSA